jgi:hypothetical protein
MNAARLRTVFFSRGFSSIAPRRMAVVVEYTS